MANKSGFLGQPRFVGCVLALAIGAAARHSIAAAAPAPETVASPVSPTESLQHIVVEPGLRVELAACEPQVVDPVEARFDEDGRMWVVQMNDYPDNSTTGKQARSRISVLEDRDDDGFFETATVFADDLECATGIQPWRGGVFVTMAGAVAYMKDTDGDGRADIRDTWYTGFAQENTQLRANHPRLALDNHIYVSNGLRGGTIVDSLHPHDKQVSISGMDFRFDPLTRDFEAVPGLGQFGQTFDDFGNRFVCTNRNPVIQVVFSNHNLEKNPLAAIAAVAHDVAKPAGESRLFPLARSWTTSNLHANQFTAACGVEFYRGEALGAEYEGSFFTCEPTAHLVHRETVRSSGVVLTSTTAREGEEFFASRDPWCSPVNLEVGPDGALYVVDMYRAVIEHPEFMPAELKQRPDLLSGNDRGRIYRVVSEQGYQRRSAARLSAADQAALVALLSDANSWQRDTAARLILERSDKSCVAALHDLALAGELPATRVRALWLLAGLDSLTDDLLLKLLDDADPRVVENAIVVADGQSKINGPLREKVIELRTNADARVRFGATLAIGDEPAPLAAPADAWQEDALLIAAGRRGGEALAMLLADTSGLERNAANAKQLVADMAALAAASRDDRQYRIAMTALLARPEYSLTGMASFLRTVVANGEGLIEVRQQLDVDGQAEFDRLLEGALRLAADSSQDEAVRIESLDIVALTEEPTELLQSIAVGDGSADVRRKAIACLGQRADDRPWRELLSRFDSETPTVRGVLLDGLLARPQRVPVLLDEIAAGRIRPTSIGAYHLERLLKHADPGIRSRVERLLAEAMPADRQQALAEYQRALELPGAAAAGRTVFEKHCASCHCVGDVGINLGPDISDSREKSPAQLLTDIIQPNRAVDANYFSYLAITSDGLTHAGLLVAETPSSITLKSADGKSISLLRQDIEQFTSTGASLMPEGLEREISPQQMANLIAYIKNWRYLKDGVPLE